MARRGRARTAALLSVMATGAALPAFAQDAGLVLDTLTVTGESSDNDGQTSGYQPLSTSTATGVVTPLLDTPQSVAVVSDQVLRDQATQTLAGALYNVSGVTAANTLGGTQDGFIRRGFGDNRDGSTLTDGLRTAFPLSFNAATERVEVLKGPSSALYGILDPGGLVNLVTKKPLETFGGSVSTYGSSFGGGQAEFDVTGPIAGSPFSFRLIGSWQDVDYWKDFGSFERNLIAPSLAWRNESTTLIASYTYEDYSIPYDRGTIYDIAAGGFVDIPRRTRLNEPFNVIDGHTEAVALDLEHRFNAAWGLNARYSYSRNTASDYQARVVGYEDGLVERSSDGTQSAYTTVSSGRVDVAGDVTLGGLRNQILFGTSYDDSDIHRTDILRCPSPDLVPIDDVADWPALTRCDIISDTVSNQKEQLSTWSLYAQDSVHLTDRLIVTGGIRYQSYDVYAGRGRPFEPATDGDGDAWIPRAAAVYKLTPEASLYASWSRSFKPQSSTSDVVGGLPPEEGDAYEAGVKYESPRGLTVTAAVYHILKQNVVFSNEDDTLSVSKEVRSQGVELDFAGQVSDRISVIGSYAYTDAETTAGEFEGMRPVNIPAHTGSIFAAYDAGPVWGGSNLRFGAGLRAQSDRAGVGDNAYFLPGYGVVDAFAAYTFDTANPVTLQINVKNVFDKTFYVASGGSDAYANVIGEPLQALVQLRMDF